MDLMIGVPSGKIIDASFIETVLNTLEFRPTYVSIAIQNDVSIGRNKLFTKARSLNKSILMLDTDVTFKRNARIRDYIEEDFNNGYDIVVAPMLAHNGAVAFTPKRKKDVIKKTPYEIKSSAFGFVAFSAKIVSEIPPLTKETTKTMEESDTLTFFWKTPSRTEDIVFCNYATKQGYKICADPRIEVNHLTTIPVTFNPELLEQIFREGDKVQKGQ